MKLKELRKIIREETKRIKESITEEGFDLYSPGDTVQLLDHEDMGISPGTYRIEAVKYKDDGVVYILEGGTEVDIEYIHGVGYWGKHI